MGVTSTSLRPRLPHRYAAGLVSAAVLGLLALGAWLLILNGGVSVVSQSRSVAPFSAVELAGGNIVTVSVGARQSVVVHAHENMLDHITTRVIVATS